MRTFEALITDLQTVPNNPLTCDRSATSHVVGQHVADQIGGVSGQVRGAVPEAAWLVVEIHGA
jgi:hypothetical protein